MRHTCEIILCNFLKIYEVCLGILYSKKFNTASETGLRAIVFHIEGIIDGSSIICFVIKLPVVLHRCEISCVIRKKEGQRGSKRAKEGSARGGRWMMRKVERNSKVSNAPIAAWRPTLIHRFVRRLNRCIYPFTSASRRRKCGVNFPSSQEKGCACRGRGASAYRWIHRFIFFFNPTDFNQSFYFLRGSNVNICLPGSKRINEKCITIDV